MKIEEFPIKMKLLTLENYSSSASVINMPLDRIMDMIKNLAKRSQIIYLDENVKQDTTNPDVSSIFSFLYYNRESMNLIKDKYPKLLTYDISLDPSKLLDSILKINWNVSLDGFYDFCKDFFYQDVTLNSKNVERLLGLFEIAFELYNSSMFKNYVFSTLKMKDLVLSPAIENLLRLIVKDKTMNFSDDEPIEKKKGMNTYFAYTSERIKHFLTNLSKCINDLLSSSFFEENSNCNTNDPNFSIENEYSFNKALEYYYLLQQVVVYEYKNIDEYNFTLGYIKNESKVSSDIKSRLKDKYEVFIELITNKEGEISKEFFKNLYIAKKVSGEINKYTEEEVNLLSKGLFYSLEEIYRIIFRRTKRNKYLSNSNNWTLVDLEEGTRNIKDGFRFSLEDNLYFKNKLSLYSRYFKVSKRMTKDIMNSSSDRTYANYLIAEYLKIYQSCLSKGIRNRIDIEVIIDFSFDLLDLFVRFYIHLKEVLLIEEDKNNEQIDFVSDLILDESSSIIEEDNNSYDESNVVMKTLEF